jgi:TRAP-type C4-dicarboxylate transport system substrate-binding protein
MRALCVTVVLLAAAAAVRADPVVLRYASMAPDGSAWAREVKAYAREVESATKGAVKVKLYLGAVAGEEGAVPERIRRGQLDGELAAVSCDRMGPSLKVLRIPGLMRRRDEAREIIERLRPTVEAEFRKAGFALLGLTWFGSDVIFSREPVRSLDDLRRMRFWIWNADQVWPTAMTQLGLHTVPLSVEEAGKAYEAGRVDGFLALPTAALVYQWSAQSHYLTKLPLATMAACNFVSNAVFDALPLDAQAAMRHASARLNYRFTDVSATQEDALLGGLLEKQGLRGLVPSETFRLLFLEATRVTRDKLPASVVPPELTQQVLGWLSDFRAAHP